MKRKLAFIYFIIDGIIGCTSPDTHQSTIISLIVDVTDTFKLNPVVNPILKLYECDQNPAAAYFFRFRVISDRRLVPTVSYHLATARILEKENARDDPQFRNKSILGFYGTVRKTIENCNVTNATKHSLGNSECYASIASELKLLAENFSAHKILIVFSDLMENTLFNAYHSSLSDPRQVAKKFEAYVPLPKNLKGVVVFFVYEPETRVKEKKYLEMMQVYKLLLEPLGATLIFQSNNTNYEPVNK